MSSLASTIALEAIASIDVRARVFDALPRLPPTRARVTVIALGKAAPTMARAAFDRWGERIARAIVVTTDGTDASALEGTHAELLRAAHPLPDARSVAAADAIFAALANRTAADVTLCLVSGGASSLVCAPIEGVSFDEKRAAIAAMLASGAPIAAINVVRRHLSKIKGGGLARASLPGRTLSMIASDVLVTRDDGSIADGSPHDVGSGPGVPDPTRVGEARAALEGYASAFAYLAERMPATAWGAEETRRTRAKIVVAPSDLAHAAAERARAHGLAVETLRPSLDSVDALADEYAARAVSLAPRTAIVRVAEPSVVVPRDHGAGGRAGRLALLVARRGLPGEVAFAAVASDGIDGSCSAAGAVVTNAMELEGADEALARFDDATFLKARGAAVITGATGKNLLDVHVLARP